MQNLQDGVLNHIPLGIAVVSGSDHQVLYSNPTFMRIGGAAADVVGLPFPAAFPHLASILLARLRRVSRSGRPARVREWQAPDSDAARAKREYWSADLIPVAANGSRAGMTIILCQNVTHAVRVRDAVERRLREAEADRRALLASEQRLRLALGVAPVAVFVRDRELRLTWSHNYRWHVSATGKEVLGTIPQELFLVEDAQSIEALYRNVIETGKSRRQVLCLRSRRSGRAHWFWLFVQPLQEPDGSVNGIVGAGYDVTELIQTRSALADREAQLHLALDAANMAAWQYLPGSRKLVHTESLSRLYGVPAGNGVSDPDIFLARLHPDDRRTMYERYTVAFDHAGVDVVTSQLRVMGDDGCERWISSRGQLLRDESGQVVRVIGIDMDITAEKRAQLLLEQSNEELEQFAYTASHDLKEPLRTMAGFAQLLERDLQDHPDSKVLQYLAHIRRGAAQMERLIDGLLEYARVGHEPELSDRVVLDEVLEEVLEQLVSSIREAGALITHDSLPVVLGNRVLLAHVMQNLLANALKFRRPDAPLCVSISAHSDGKEWVLAVRDNGMGISVESQDAIFQPFHRGSGSGGSPGSGLGLSLCRKIIERHRGRIWVESTPGRGASFFFTLRAPR